MSTKYRMWYWIFCMQCSIVYSSLIRNVILLSDSFNEVCSRLGNLTVLLVHIGGSTWYRCSCSTWQVIFIKRYRVICNGLFLSFDILYAHMMPSVKLSCFILLLCCPGIWHSVSGSSEGWQRSVLIFRGSNEGHNNLGGYFRPYG